MLKANTKLDEFLCAYAASLSLGLNPVKNAFDRNKRHHLRRTINMGNLNEDLNLLGHATAKRICFLAS